MSSAGDLNAMAAPLKKAPTPGFLQPILDMAHDHLLLIRNLGGQLPCPEAPVHLAGIISECCRLEFIIPMLIEMSIIDPDDPAQMRVLAPVLLQQGLAGSTHAGLLDTYREEMESSLHPEDQGRGPIVPHPGLYERWGWFHRINRPAVSWKPAVTAPVKWEGFLLSYPLTFAAELGDIKTNIKGFAEAMCNPRSGHAAGLPGEVNCLLVVPFPGPVGERTSEQPHAGGALFVWGQAASDTDDPLGEDPRLLAPLRSVLLETVLRYSAARAKLAAALAQQGLFCHHLKCRFRESGALELDFERLQEQLELLQLDLTGHAVGAGISERLTKLCTLVRNLQETFSAGRVHAVEFREVFELLMQSTLDDPVARLQERLRNSSCQLADVVGGVSPASPTVRFGLPEGVQIPDVACLPGPELVYRVVFQELVRNAESEGASDIQLLILGDQWQGEPNWREGPYYFILRDNAHGPPTQLRFSGLLALERFVVTVLGGSFSFPRVRTDDQTGSEVRFHLQHTWLGR